MFDKEHESTSLQILFDLGMVGGKQKSRRKTYSGLRANATATKIGTFAEAIVSLQKNNHGGTFVNERSTILA